MPTTSGRIRWYTEEVIIRDRYGIGLVEPHCVTLSNMYGQTPLVQRMGHIQIK